MRYLRHRDYVVWEQKCMSNTRQSLDVRENYKPLATPMVSETAQRVTEPSKALYHGNHIDGMTLKWLSLTRNPLRIPILANFLHTYHRQPFWRPIVSGYESPTERISSFVDNLLQPIAKVQKSCLKDATYPLTS